MKFLFKWIGILILLAAVAIAAAWFFAPRLAAYKIGSDLGTRASVDTFRIGLTQTDFGGITVMSPPGSRSAKALTVKSGEARTSPLSALTANPYTVDRVYMKDLQLFLDFPRGPSLKTGNWGEMLSYSDAHTDPNAREVVIRELILENLDVTMIGIDGKTTKLKPIDRLRLTNVSSKAGVNKSELMGLVFSQILIQVLSVENILPALEKVAVEGVQNVKAGAQEAVSGAASELKKGFGEIFGGSPPSQP